MRRVIAGSAVERLLDRISDRFDRERAKPDGYRRTQAGLARRLGISEGSLSGMLHRSAARQGLLAHLDKIADYFGETPTTLIQRLDTTLAELTDEEFKLMRRWRALPPDIRDQVMRLFDFYAELLPEEQAAREVWSRWRQLHAEGRVHVDRVLTDALRSQRKAARAKSGYSVEPGRNAETDGPTRRRRRP